MKEFSWIKITGLCITLSIIFGIIGGALTNEYFISYIFSNFIQQQQENSPIVKKVIEERTFVEESLIKDAFDKGVPSLAALYRNEAESANLTRGQTTGTGFFITTDGLFATCKSTVSSQKIWYLKANDGILYRAVLDYTDPTMDLAFLRIEREESTPYFKAVDFSENPMALSQKILVPGIDAESYQHVKSGLVAYTGAKDIFGEYDELDFDIDNYLNCGPVLNLGGEVHGMAVKQNKTGKTSVIPAEYINERFLNYNK